MQGLVMKQHAMKQQCLKTGLKATDSRGMMDQEAAAFFSTFQRLILYEKSFHYPGHFSSPGFPGTCCLQVDV